MEEEEGWCELMTAVDHHRRSLVKTSNTITSCPYLHGRLSWTVWSRRTTSHSCCGLLPPWSRPWCGRESVSARSPTPGKEATRQDTEGGGGPPSPLGQSHNGTGVPADPGGDHVTTPSLR